MRHIALVGVGPHSKRIYFHYFKKHKISLELVIELESHKEIVRQYLDTNGFYNTRIFTIADKYKDYKHLPKNIYSDLLAVCKTFEITHIIVSTEPKAHYMYIEFALKNNINVLTDKPITVTKNMTSLRSINEVRKRYYELLNLGKKSKASCKIMCQRQYHKGYELVKKLLVETVTKYQIPITYIDIFHTDGNWEFPHDLNKENHPYKYGYGKLYHSGYHFIDLLSDFIKINDLLKGNKRITKGEVYSKVFTPNDELKCINIEDYKRLFKNQKVPNYYYINKNPKFKKYGEKNYHGLFSFYNSQGFTITTANLNLLHDAFSRRAWIESKNYYKENGRVRHERLNIEVGHLLNIQVHSYQSKEINERTKNEEDVGGLEHFDIYIFRNPLLKGKTFEKIRLGDLYTEKEKEGFLGYNEFSREVFLKKFLNNKDCRSDLKDQILGIEILYSCSKSIFNYYKNIKKVEKINIKNKSLYPIKLETLKKYAYIDNKNYKKELLYFKDYYKDIYRISIIENYVYDKKYYEVYISINDILNQKNKSISGLLNKKFKNKNIAKLYFKILNKFITKSDILFIFKVIEKKIL